MVFSNPNYPALSRFFANAAARKRRRTSSRMPSRPTKRIRVSLAPPPQVSSYRRKVRLLTGDDPNSIPSNLASKKSTGYDNFSSNDFIKVDVVDIPRKTTTNQDLNTRERDVIYVSGMKVNVHAFNTCGVDLYLNMAIITTKKTATNVGLDLFTSPGGTSRAANFTNVGLTPFERHTLPINSDEYQVHWHSRVLMCNAAFPTNSNGLAPKLFELFKYVAINRQIRFDGAAAESETGVYFVHWAGIAGEDAADPIIKTSNAYKLDYSILTYYRDT